MAILRSKEIWDMEVDEIQDKLVELRAELSKNKFGTWKLMRFKIN